MSLPALQQQPGSDSEVRFSMMMQACGFHQELCMLLIYISITVRECPAIVHFCHMH